MTRICVNIMV